MGRTPAQTEDLHKFIFAEYIWLGRGQSSILKKIEDDPDLRRRFGGDISGPVISYHVKQINEELENSIDFDAMDKFVGEYLRYQQTIDNEINDIEGMINLIDKEKKPELWLTMKKYKKDLLDSRLRALADHELPLAVKKFKKERSLKRERVIQLSEVVEPTPIGVDEELKD